MTFLNDLNYKHRSQPAYERSCHFGTEKSNQIIGEEPANGGATNELEYNKSQPLTYGPHLGFVSVNNSRRNHRAKSLKNRACCCYPRTSPRQGYGACSPVYWPGKDNPDSPSSLRDIEGSSYPAVFAIEFCIYA
jgi:hypothetical protein